VHAAAEIDVANALAVFDQMLDGVVCDVSTVAEMQEV